MGAVAARAKALLWPAVDRTRGEGEALLPGITSPSGLHVFVSADARPGRRLAADFEPWWTARARLRRRWRGCWGSTTSASRFPPEHFNQEMAFFRTLFGLTPAPVEEFMEPHGRLRSRALRPAAGDLRVVLNVEDVAPGTYAARGSTRWRSRAPTWSAGARRCGRAGSR